jgi:hypothetical protein
MSKKCCCKKGHMNIHHYSHVNSECTIPKDKDSKSIWHIFWQKIVKEKFLEKIIKKDGKIHIADIFNDDNIIIEIQHSPINYDNITEREMFYDNMIWIVDGCNVITNDEFISNKLEIYINMTNDYKIIKTTTRFWSLMKKQVFIDNDGQILKIVKCLTSNFYIVLQIDINVFFNKYFKNILKNDVDTTIKTFNDFTNSKYKKEEYTCTNFLSETSKNFTKKMCCYDETTDTFFGLGTYEVRKDLCKLGYRYDKNDKIWKFNVIHETTKKTTLPKKPLCEKNLEKTLEKTLEKPLIKSKCDDKNSLFEKMSLIKNIESDTINSTLDIIEARKKIWNDDNYLLHAKCVMCSFDIKSQCFFVSCYEVKDRENEIFILCYICGKIVQNNNKKKLFFEHNKKLFTIISIDEENEY